MTEAAGSDQFGRPIFGQLAQQGSVLTAVTGSNRRFAEFDQVWALNPDGWSKQIAATVSLDHRVADGLELFGSYTWSETKDNWLGAFSGRPDAVLDPGLDRLTITPWGEGKSDLDIPHRVTAGVPGVAQNEANRSSEFELGRTFSLEDATFGKDLLATRAILGLALQRVQLFNRLIVAVSRPWSNDLSADHGARVASSYLSTVELVGVLGEYYGFVPIFFWQPSLHGTQKPLTPYEQNLMRAIDSDAFQVAGKDILTTLTNSISTDAASRSIAGFRDISGVFDDPL